MRHPVPRATLCLATFLALTACTPFPELDAAVDPAVARLPYPAIIPLDRLLGSARTGTMAPTGLDARAAALRARADGLRAAP